MPSNYIELFPPNSPRRQPLHNGFDNIYYFPSCRVHETSPDPSTAHNNGRKLSRRHQNRCPSPIDSEPKQSPHHSPLPKTGLGANNVVNTIQVTVEQAKVNVSQLFPVGGDTDSLVARVLRSCRQSADWNKQVLTTPRKGNTSMMMIWNGSSGRLMVSRNAWRRWITNWMWFCAKYSSLMKSRGL